MSWFSRFLAVVSYVLAGLLIVGMLRKLSGSKLEISGRTVVVEPAAVIVGLIMAVVLIFGGLALWRNGYSR